MIAALAQDPWLFFAGILVVMTFGDGAFGILNAFGAEQFPNEARSTGLGLGYGIGAMAKVVGPFLMGALIGGDAIKQNVTRDAVPPAFYLFAVLLVIGGVLYALDVLPAWAGCGMGSRRSLDPWVASLHRHNSAWPAAH